MSRSLAGQVFTNGRPAALTDASRTDLVPAAEDRLSTGPVAAVPLGVAGPYAECCR